MSSLLDWVKAIASERTPPGTAFLVSEVEIDGPPDEMGDAVVRIDALAPPSAERIEFTVTT